MKADQSRFSPNSREYRNLKRREYLTRARMANMVRDAHIRMAAYIWSVADTAVIPVLHTHRMARRDDRRIGTKTVRQMFSLKHGAFRSRMRHSADTMGKEYVNVSEEYTTIGCPGCLRVNAPFPGEVFTCSYCPYTAPRDAKSALMLAIKCLAPRPL